MTKAEKDAQHRVELGNARLTRSKAEEQKKKALEERSKHPKNSPKWYAADLKVREADRLIAANPLR